MGSPKGTKLNASYRATHLITKNCRAAFSHCQAKRQISSKSARGRKRATCLTQVLDRVQAPAHALILGVDRPEPELRQWAATSATGPDLLAWLATSGRPSQTFAQSKKPAPEASGGPQQPAATALPPIGWRGE
jgi:hypothetical protein